MVFDSITLVTSDAEYLFMYLLAIGKSSLKKMSLHILCPFFSWIVCLLLSYMNSLYILSVNPLSDIPFANMFSHSVGCLITLLIVSFAIQ